MQSIGIILILFLFAAAVYAQPQVQPATDPRADNRRQQDELEARRRAAELARLRSVSESARRSRPVSKDALRDFRELYRKPSEKELQKLRPLDEDLLKYSAFLKDRRTGITRLEPYRGCGDLTKVLSASDDCLEFSMPGNGSDYSFRKRSYRLGRLADLRLETEAFSSPGVLQQAVFVGLGDVPLESIGAHTPGMAYIAKLRPSEDVSSVVEISERFKHGSENDGFYYAAAVRAVENMTYVLRSVAYRGRILRSVAGAVYNELDLDERADVTVAFRIVRKHDSGGVTILWREIARRKSPELSGRKPTHLPQNRFEAARHPQEK